MIAAALAWFAGKRALLSSVSMAAPWIIAGLGIVGALYYRERYQSCRASGAIEAAKAEEKVRAQKEADAKFTRVLEEQLQAATAEIRSHAHAASIALAKVKSDPNCASTDAARAFDGGVRPVGPKADPGPSRPARP